MPPVATRASRPRGGSPFAELLIVAALVAAATAALGIAGAGGWKGRSDACLVDGRCFCERDRGGWIRQPANTLSNLGFIAVGVGIAWSLGRERRRGDAPRAGNPMTATRFYPGFYAALVALLGPGSMALHASLTSWGSVLDLVSMNAFIAFVFSYALVRWRGLGTVAFLAAFVLVDAVLLAVKLVHGHGSGAFGATAVVALGIELRARRRSGVSADSRMLGAAAAVFLASFGIWLASRNDGWLCVPDSWLQGHGAWHLGCALSTWLLYLSMRSERALPGARD